MTPTVDLLQRVPSWDRLIVGDDPINFFEPEPVRPAPVPRRTRVDRWIAAHTREVGPRGRHTYPKGVPMLKSVVPSALRTFVPLIVGFLIGLPVVKWLGLTDEQVTSAVTVVIVAVYWTAGRILERVHPSWGWLLGYASQPVYVQPAASGMTPTPESDVTRVVRS